MVKLLWAALTGVLAVVLLIFLVALRTILGAFSGWAVALFLNEPLLNVFAAAGVHGLELWEVGAALGFVSGFFVQWKTGD